MPVLCVILAYIARPSAEIEGLSIASIGAARVPGLPHLVRDNGPVHDTLHLADNRPTGG